MALDFAILDDAGRPTATVPVGPELHAALISAAEQHGLRMLLRFSDYYSDAEIAPGELGDLLRELEAVSSTSDAALARTVQQLFGLAEEARKSARALHALAD